MERPKLDISYIVLNNKYMSVFFSEVFEVEKELLESYGAFDISLATDLPLFIDPFLLYDSSQNKYSAWHDELVNYLKFLKGMSISGPVPSRVVNYYYRFPEVKQNWLGFTRFGNSGRGLGPAFANSLNDNLSKLFSDFGDEDITKGSHIEKLCLIRERVGKDSISDFTTNIVKRFLLEYTQEFALDNIDTKHLKTVRVPRAQFDYNTGVWMSKSYTLPYFDGDYVILTPKDILTQDEAWINRNDLYADFESIPPTIENENLRMGVSSHFYGQLGEENTKDDRIEAAIKTVNEYPEVIDYYIRNKEDTGSHAHQISEAKVERADEVFRQALPELTNDLKQKSEFFDIKDDSYDESLRKVNAFKAYVENNDGYKVVSAALKVARTEEVVQLFFGLAWLDSPYDVNREVNNGRGPVDFKVSMGSQDKTVIEFKLAGNAALKKNLSNQAEIYAVANNTNKIIKVIFVTTEHEAKKIESILNELKMNSVENVIVIDARADNKPSASKAG